VDSDTGIRGGRKNIRKCSGLDFVRICNSSDFVSNYMIVIFILALTKGRRVDIL
jgi:hypothetical protein